MQTEEYLSLFPTINEKLPELKKEIIFSEKNLKDFVCWFEKVRTFMRLCMHCTMQYRILTQRVKMNKVDMYIVDRCYNKRSIRILKNNS